jgi:hypothetical protein
MVQKKTGNPGMMNAAKRKIMIGKATIVAGAAAVALAAAACSTAGGTSAPAGRAGVAGTWTGTYTCSQGLTGTRLVLRDSGGKVTGTSSIYPVKSNPGVPHGEITVSGTYSAARGLVVSGRHWIHQPAGYVPVGFSGRLSRSGTELSGRVTGRDDAGCTTFMVRRTGS